MDRLKMLAGAAAPFAHLLGLRPTATAATAVVPPAAKAAEDDDKKDKKDEDAKARRADESDDDYAKRMAEDGDDDEKAEEDDEDDKAEEDDDKDKAVKAAVVAERARCSKIFSAKSAAIRPDVAATLAFTTDMSATDAVVALDAAASGMTRRKGLHERMAETPAPANPGVGGAPAPAAGPSGDAASIVSKILAAGGGVGVVPTK